MPLAYSKVLTEVFLLQAKLKEINENVEESLERLTQSYKNESARKSPLYSSHALLHPAI